MARPKNLTPSYLKHGASGRGRAVWTDPGGERKQRLLPGPHGSKESLQAFARLQLELATSPTTTATARPRSIAEAILQYVKHAELYYPNSNEAVNIKLALRGVRELYADLPVTEFGPKKLAAVREKFIRDGLTRQGANKRTRLIVRCFKWLAAEELIPASVYESLKTLSGLKAGRSDAPESQPRTPVPEADYLATLAHLRGHVRAMVELLAITGARPGELCRMRLADIDRSGLVWVYRPAEHKTAYRGKTRAVMLGPKAQAVLLAHLEQRGGIGPDDPIFSPRANREERFRAMRAARKSRVQPSQASRKKRKPERLPAVWYSPNGLSQAVRKACRKAGVPGWFPYQLRHTYASNVRRAHGLEAAQVLLGHAAADVTQVYAQRDEAKAAEVAALIG